MKKMLIEVLDYEDVGSFLNDFYRAKKSANSRWSYAGWARSLRMKDKTLLIRAVQGSRAVTSRLAEKLVAFFPFNDRQRAHFRLLCACSQIEIQGERLRPSEVMELRMNSILKKKRVLEPGLGPVYLSAWGGWLMTMAQGQGIPRETDELRQWLKVPCEAGVLERKIEDMVAVGLLKPDESGQRWVAAEGIVNVSDFPVEQVRLYDYEVYKMAGEFLAADLQSGAAPRVSSSGIYLRLSAEKVKEFRKAVFHLAAQYAIENEDLAGDVTYQMLISGFIVADSTNTNVPYSEI
jgi:uncharacterized protein (TIGR02147 family)